MGALTVGTSTISGTLSLQGGLTATALPTPSAPTITTGGTAGSTTYSYTITALDGVGETIASSAGSTATGNATLTAGNYTIITWNSISGATSYKVYRTVGGATQGLITTVTTKLGATQTTNDTGLAASGSSPTTNTTGGAILQGGGLTLGTASTTNGTLVLRNSTNANTVTLQTGTTSSSYSLVLPTAVGTTGQCLSTTVAGAVSTLGWATCNGSGLLSSNNTWSGTNSFQITSTTALRIQTAAGASNLLVADTQNGTITLGAGSNTLTFASTGITLAGTVRPDITITLSPEYQGATFAGDGTNNNGSLSSDFCSGSSRQNINTTICAATETHNYYAWTTTQATAQDYDIYVRYQLPSDYDTGSMTNLKIWGWGTTSANEQVTVALISDASGTACSTSSNAITSNTTWQQATVGSPLGACTPAAGDMVTFKVHVVAGQNNYARAGEISFAYKKKF